MSDALRHIAILPIRVLQVVYTPVVVGFVSIAFLRYVGRRGGL